MRCKLPPILHGARPLWRNLRSITPVTPGTGCGDCSQRSRQAARLLVIQALFDIKLRHSAFPLFG